MVTELDGAGEWGQVVPLQIHSEGRASCVFQQRIMGYERERRQCWTRTLGLSEWKDGVTSSGDSSSVRGPFLGDLWAGQRGCRQATGCELRVNTAWGWRRMCGRHACVLGWARSNSCALWHHVGSQEGSGVTVPGWRELPQSCWWCDGPRARARASGRLW